MAMEQEGKGNRVDRDRPPSSACRRCGSETHEEVLKVVLWIETRLVAIQGIPASVCPECGEQYYDEGTVERVQKVMARPAEEAREQISVPVVSLGDVRLPGEARPAGEVDGEEGGDVQQGGEDLLCESCQSSTREDVVKTAVWGDRGMVAIEGIPARVCEGCGESFYSAEAATEIMRLADGGVGSAKVIRTISAPLFSLEEMDARGSDGGPG